MSKKNKKRRLRLVGLGYRKNNSLKSTGKRNVREKINIITNSKNVFIKNYDTNILNYQVKLMNMSNIVAEYDYKMHQLNIWAVRINPEFKMKYTQDFSKIYSNKISDLSLLNSKFKGGEISYNKFVKQINDKIREITSYEKELSDLRGGDNFRSSFINVAVNTLNESIWYVYFDPDTGEINYETGIMYANLGEKERRIVLDNIYNNSTFWQNEFSKEDFIEKMIETSNEFDKKDEV